MENIALEKGKRLKIIADEQDAFIFILILLFAATTLQIIFLLNITYFIDVIWVFILFEVIWAVLIIFVIRSAVRKYKDVKEGSDTKKNIEHLLSSIGTQQEEEQDKQAIKGLVDKEQKKEDDYILR